MSNSVIPNRLGKETSPYLLQHAHNPVNWYPWGEEAFEKAKNEDKPIFLSIGYSTCHWCHVMERESFEDEEVAKLMNEAFVNIKVDREERPDIDGVYMDVCLALIGSGGWPLTIIMTPDQKPFFAGTYILKNTQYRRMGMMEFIPQIQDMWENQRSKVLSTAEEIIKHINSDEKKKWDKSLIQSSPDKKEIQSLMRKTYESLEYSFDKEKGGFGDAPKFPTPHRLTYLLRYYRHTKNIDSLDMVSRTLNHMRMGGVYDQIGYGFHRYSTDNKWLLPHFEKMLYDQALMAVAYIEAYQVTKEEVYKWTAEEILKYVSRDLMDETGAFYCAEDADSEGEEGKFYVWTEREIEDLLKEEAEYGKKYFGIQKKGNYLDESTREMTGKNVCYIDCRDKLLSIHSERVNTIREILYNEREKRVRPALDNKVLTDWNGLMIKAFAMAGKVFENTEYISIAQRACDFFLESLTEEKKLFHTYGKGMWDIEGHLDDYAFLIQGILECYQSTLDERYLQEAITLSKRALELFWDDDGAGFYFTSKEGEELIIRKKEIYDGAIPSGNSVMLNNLLKLSLLTDVEEFSRRADEMIDYFHEDLLEHPSGYTEFISGILLAYGKCGQITISGDLDREETKDMLKQISSEYLPNILVKFTPSKDKTQAILCLNKTCSEATENINEILEQLNL